MERKKKKREPLERFSISMPKSLFVKVEKLASEEKSTRSKIIQEMVKAYGAK